MADPADIFYDGAGRGFDLHGSVAAVERQVLVTGGPPSLLPGRVISDNAAMSHPNIEVQASTVVGHTRRWPVVIRRSGSDISVLLGHQYKLGILDQQPTTPLFVKCSIELPGYFNKIVPLFFNGQREARLDGGAVVSTDLAGLDLVAGETVFLRVFHRVLTAGDAVWGHLTSGYANEGAWLSDGDQTLVAAPAVTTNPVGYGYTPMAILSARPADPHKPYVAICGDSNMAGQGDDTRVSPGFGDRAVRAAGLDTLMLGVPGAIMNNLKDPSGGALLRAMVAGASHALVCYGTNYFYGAGVTAPIMVAELVAAAALLRRRGVQRVVVCTIPPRTTSSDNFTTLAGQTLNAAEAVRAAYNDLVRAGGIAGVDGYADTADALESSRNSGKWTVGLTQDGTHPNGAGHSAMAAAITPGLLLGSTTSI